MSSEPQTKRPGHTRGWAVLGASAILCFFLFVALRMWVFQPYSIASASMEPTLIAGDYVIVNRSSYGWNQPLLSALFEGPERGDVVIFRREGRAAPAYVGRLLGLPGDKLQLRSGVIYLNGVPFHRQSLASAMGHLDGDLSPVVRFDEQTPKGRHYTVQLAPDSGDSEDTGIYRVPPHCYFILYDNRDNAADSRFDPIPLGTPGSPACGWDKRLDASVGPYSGVGFVPAANLIGKAQLIAFSVDLKTDRFREDRLYKPVS